MTQQTQQARFHIAHSAVVTARMPTDGECATGYPPGVPVLVVTSHAGRVVKVFSSASIALAVGDPEGVPDAEAVTSAADYVFSIIAEGLDNAGARLTALADAARRSPGSIIRLADDYRREYETDTASCQHPAGITAGGS